MSPQPQTQRQHSGKTLLSFHRFPCGTPPSLTEGAGRITQAPRRMSSPPGPQTPRRMSSPPGAPGPQEDVLPPGAVSTTGCPLASPQSSPSQRWHPILHTAHARSRAPSSLRLSAPPAPAPAQIWNTSHRHHSPCRATQVLGKFHHPGPC